MIGSDEGIEDVEDPLKSVEKLGIFQKVAKKSSSNSWEGKRKGRKVN